MVDMMEVTPVKPEPSDENFQLLDVIKEDLSESVVESMEHKESVIDLCDDKKHAIVNIKIKEELIKEDAEEEEECRFIKDEKITDFEFVKTEDCNASIKSEELNIEEEDMIKDEEIGDIEIEKAECYASIKSEELHIKEEDSKNYFLCDCGEEDNVTFCSKCTMLLVIKDNPVPMGTPDRAVQTIPKDTFELKTSLINGMGIFALRSLQKGVQLGPYEGKLAKLEATEGYSWKLHGERLVDASDNRYSNYLRYINSTKDVSEQNLVPFQFKGELYYRTSRVLKEGEELLVNFNSISTDSYFKPQEESFEETFFTCKFCRVTLKSKQLRDRHQTYCKFQPNRKKIDGETFQCRHCQYFVTTWNFLIAHERRCTVGKRIASHVKKYTCEHCDYSTSRRSNLTCHMNAKHEQKDLFRCIECDYTTFAKNNLYTHKRNHVVVKAFKCPVCQNGFHSKLNLDAHIISRHPDMSHIIKRQIHKCPDCGYATVHKFHMKRHLLQHDQGTEQSYKCDKCNYKTCEKRHLKRHLLSHSQTKSWICSVCREAFNHKKTLDSHIFNNHPDNEEALCSISNKINVCEICNYRTINTGVFNKHCKRHKKNAE